MSKKIALILKNLIWNCSHWSDSQVAMHCLSAREYRVGVDVVADAVQVLSLHIESTKEHCIHSKIFFFFIWLPQPWSDYFCECARQPWMPSLLKSDGSRRVWHRWGTKIFKTFGTKLQTLDPVQISWNFVNLVFLSTTTTYKGHFSWWDRYSCKRKDS